MDDHSGNRVGWASFSATRTRSWFTSLPYSILFIGYNFMLIIPPTSLHDFAFITILLNLVLLKFQGINNTTPFQTHPNTVNAAAISFLLLVYCTRFLQPGALFLNHFVFLFWSLCVASLLSLLLPDAIRPFLYVLSIVPFIVAVLRRVCLIIWTKFWDLQRILFLRHLFWHLYRTQMQHPRLPI